MISTRDTNGMVIQCESPDEITLCANHQFEYLQKKTDNLATLLSIIVKSISDEDDESGYAAALQPIVDALSQIANDANIRVVYAQSEQPEIA